jgi:uncharacterized protein (DUF302 family)
MKPQEITTDSTSGIIRFSSPWSFNETVERIETLLRAKQIKLFARIDQASEAAAVGLTLRPTTLLVFGDPAKGTPLMDAHPGLALDLPLKALVWETAPGEVYIGLTSPEFLQQRHSLPQAPFAEVVRLFTTFIKSGAQPPGS